MGYNTWGANQLLWNAIHRDNAAPAVNNSLTPTFTMMVGGLYNLGGVTYADGDAATMQFTSDGKLMVDTEMTVDGNVIVDNVAVWATDIADSNTSSFALVDLAGHPQVDVLTMPGGMTGYTLGTDTYTEATSVGLAAAAVRNDTLAALADTDNEFAPLQVNAKGGLYVDVSSVLGTDMSVTNGGFMQITDNTTRVDVGVDESTMAATPGFLPVGGEYRASDTTYTDGDATVAQSDVNGHLKVRGRGYDAGTDSQKVFEVSPVNQQFVSESLVDTTNVSTDSYPSTTGATMDGYSDLSLTGQMIEAGGESLTLTVEATNDEDTAAGIWIDVTPAGYRADDNTTGNASIIANAGSGTVNFALDFDNFNYRYYRVTVTATDSANNTLSLKARRKAI